MKKNKRWTQRLLSIVLVLTVIGCMGACGKRERTRFDVLKNLDMSSVVQDGEYTNFSATTEDGKTVRFQGKGITVSENGITMVPGAYLVSLDYIGKICGFVLDADEEQNIVDYGIAYADAPGVNNMTELHAAYVWGVAVLQKVDVDISGYQSGFFAVSAWSENETDTHVTALEICYDDTVAQVLYQDLEPAGEIAELLEIYRSDWEIGEAVEIEDPLLMKLEEPGVLQSDIVAGIDHNSVVVDGTTTFFSSVMCDGTVVRFEGENISIDETGITVRPDSKVTSLDAVGKIYGYSAYIEDGESYGHDATFDYGYGYTYSAEKTSVERASEVHTYGISGAYPFEWNEGIWWSAMAFEPNFVFVLGNPYYEQDLVVSSLTIAYDPAEKVTAMVEAKLNDEFIAAYMEGDKYNPELADPADGNVGYYDFYLCLRPDTPYSHLEDNGGGIWFVPKDFYEVGDLKDAEGNVLDKSNAKMMPGTTLEIFVGDFTVSLEFPLVERYMGAQTMNDLVPYAFPEALGVNNVLVVPIAWADQKENANEATMDLYRENLGRIMDENGNITDYSDLNDEEFSLSEYFDVSSYGKLTVNSFMTDWYYSDKNFADAGIASPEKAFGDEILEWVKTQYPDLDWSQYDRDSNGYVDSMVLINSGVSATDELYIISYSGAIHYRESYFGDFAGTPEDPNVNTFVTVNDSFLRKEGADTLIHEFSHNFGIIDYYDVGYSGINAVGGFDMQSNNAGDWNAYSKLAVGWMDPQVVTGLESGESMELTIGSSALTDDVILIPAKGTGYEGPFSEYIMIDLLTDDGVNQYDAAAYGLQDVAGVRISHVNATMEKRTLEVESKTIPGEVNTYDIGTIHYANNYVDDGKGYYNIEVIQSGRKNTFTDLKNVTTNLSKDDLFYAGDTFTVENYSEFFYQGLMDDESEFGYVIKIVDIGADTDGNPTATVRVTAQ